MQFTHTAPSIIGSNVRVEAEVVEIVGNSLIFKITAFDDIGEIGKGRYERAVVVRDELLRRAADRVASMAKVHP